MFKSITGVNCNAYIPTRGQPAGCFRKGVEELCAHPKSMGATHQCLGEFRFNVGYITPIARFLGFSGKAKLPLGPFAVNWRLYTQAKEPGSPAPSKAVPSKSSVKGIAGVQPVNKSRSRMDQIKQMLKDKMRTNDEKNQK